MNNWHIFTIGLVAFGVTLLLLPVVRRFASSRGYVSEPANARWSHTPTPYLGGLAIVIGSVAASTLVQPLNKEMTILMVAAIGVAVIGLIDDLRTASIVGRLAVEGTAAVAVYTAGIHPNVFHGVADLLLCVVWLIVITNAFNYLDNIDGALAAVAIPIAIAIAVAAELGNLGPQSAIACAVAGSCVAFIRFNWHPASIYMGDCGSLFVGFVLGALSLALRGPSMNKAPLATVMLMATPLFDMTLVYISRARARRPIHVGGIDHTSHRLVNAGLTVRHAAVVLLFGTSATCALAILVARHKIAAAQTGVVGLAVAAMLIWVLLRITVAYPRPPRVEPMRRSNEFEDEVGS